MIRLRDVQVLGPAGLSCPRDAQLASDEDESLDGRGLVLSAGWADLHAHLRDPGFTHKETLESGTASAAAGGYTHVVAMANTMPATDRASLVRANIERARGLPIRVDFVGALTHGLDGQVLTDAQSLREAGAVALSDDGRHAMDPVTLVEGLAQAAQSGLPVLVHAQDERLGMTRAAELEGTRGAIEALRRRPSAHLHLQHVSIREAVDLVARAKRAGLHLTAEVTPHHLALTQDETASLGPQAFVNPPLRGSDDLQALRAALIDGTIDVVATDHAPHDAVAKANGANGFHGFETACAVILALELPWEVVYRACVAGPRAILGRTVPDDWVLIDPAGEWVVDPERFRSRGRNTPFAGRRMRGAVRMTVCHGRVVYRSEVPVG